MAWHRRCCHLLILFNFVHDAQSRTVKVRGAMHTIVGRTAQMQRTVLELENVRNRWRAFDSRRGNNSLQKLDA